MGAKDFDINNIASFEKNCFLINLNLSLLSSLQSVELGLSPVYELKKGLSLGLDIRYNLERKSVSSLVGCAFEVAPFNIDFGIGYFSDNKTLDLTSGIVFDL